MTDLPLPIEKLVSILGWARESGGDCEDAFINNIADWVDDTTDHDWYFDETAYKNLYITIPLENGDPSDVLWTAHTDTVANVDGQQRVHISTKKIASLDSRDHKKFGCLGADCGTGIWLMLNMIASNVPGTYAFFRSEEAGRLGSEAASAMGYGNEFKYCISFDRHSFNSVITYQSSKRCCSDAFAKALGDQLYDTPYLDPHGSFTDSYSFMQTIPECTNISVGYKHQHTTGETQDLKFAAYLARKLIQFDESKLVVERDPKIVERRVWDRQAGGYVPDYGVWPADDPLTEYEREQWGEYADYNRTLEDMVTDHPLIVADLLREYGFDEGQLRDIINGYIGTSVPDKEAA